MVCCGVLRLGEWEQRLPVPMRACWRGSVFPLRAQAEEVVASNKRRVI